MIYLRWQRCLDTFSFKNAEALNDRKMRLGFLGFQLVPGSEVVDDATKTYSFKLDFMLSIEPDLIFLGIFTIYAIVQK